MTDRDNVLRKIRALLQKTVANGCPVEEALTAHAKAQALIEEYQVSHEELFGTGPGGRWQKPKSEPEPAGSKQQEQSQSRAAEANEQAYSRSANDPSPRGNMTARFGNPFYRTTTDLTVLTATLVAAFALLIPGPSRLPPTTRTAQSLPLPAKFSDRVDQDFGALGFDARAAGPGNILTPHPVLAENNFTMPRKEATPGPTQAVPQGVASGLPAPPAQSPVAAAQPAGTAMTPSAVAAQHAVLLEQDPGDPQGKRFDGTVTWRTETVSPGPGLAPELEVHADIAIPQRHMTVTLSLRRNTDKALPASHTIQMMFNLPPDFPGQGVSSMPGVFAKDSEQATGTPLAGISVKVTDNYFLLGLSADPTQEQHNVQLLKDQKWFDIAMVYKNNTKAILAVERSPLGDRTFANAFAAWEGSPPQTPSANVSQPLASPSPRQSTNNTSRFDAPKSSKPSTVGSAPPAQSTNTSFNKFFGQPPAGVVYANAPPAGDLPPAATPAPGGSTRDPQAANNDSEAVPLKDEGGNLVVPVAINGLPPLPFTIDSGATYVNIPPDVFLTLLRTGTLQESDFIGREKFTLADGSTIQSRTFFIRSLKVGNHVLTNVKASVAADVKAGSLLGQSFLGRFKSWSIDNKRQVLLLNAPPFTVGTFPNEETAVNEPGPFEPPTAQPEETAPTLTTAPTAAPSQGCWRWSANFGRWIFICGQAEPPAHPLVTQNVPFFAPPWFAGRPFIGRRWRGARPAFVRRRRY